MTYAGSDDFRTLSPADIHLQILAACMQDSPILLKASNFNLPLTNTDAFEIGPEMNGRFNSLLGLRSALPSFMRSALQYPSPLCRLTWAVTHVIGLHVKLTILGECDVALTSILGMLMSNIVLTVDTRAH
jgi:hypothetical protein